MHTIKKTESIKIKTPRPTAEERANLLAEMKKEFDEMKADPAKAKLEQPDRDFWNKFA